MRDAVAIQRYVERYSETGLPACPVRGARWEAALVLPAYREDATLLGALAALAPAAGRVLVLLVLNRPDSCADAAVNEPLRRAVRSLPPATAGAPLYCLADGVELYLHDMDSLGGPLPAAQGVGLARKTGCDIALAWWCAGALASDWLHLTDADATLPRDYLQRLRDAPPGIVAATFPFHHVASGDDSLDLATALYELRLHQYVLGLEYANSPYAFHALGSSLAVRMSAYCHVRGIPRRSGAEDFYLLNKLAKIGRVVRLSGNCVRLASRASDRVPFGTGPAVAAIQAAPQPLATTLFYDPRCFAVLRALLRCVRDAARAQDWRAEQALAQAGVDAATARHADRALAALGLATALAHCRRHGATRADFTRHFHLWFDGFRTLKFIHALRDAALPDVSLQALAALQPVLWPTPAADPAQLRAAIARHWAWQR